MANLVKFVASNAANFAALQNKDANTIYFIQDGDLFKIYKGSVLYDGTSPTVAANLATLESYIGTLPVDEAYTDLIDYIDKMDAATASAAASALSALDGELAAVAKSGAAEDIAITDAAGYFTATDAEAAFQEMPPELEFNPAAMPRDPMAFLKRKNTIIRAPNT